MKKIIYFVLGLVLTITVAFPQSSFADSSGDTNSDMNNMSHENMDTYNTPELNKTNSLNVIVVAQQKLSTLPKDDLNKLYAISEINKYFSVSIDGDTVTTTDTHLVTDRSTAKVITMTQLATSMDALNGTKLKEGSKITPMVMDPGNGGGGSSITYPNNGDNQHVVTGTHVHCNRFNGPESDHRYHKNKLGTAAMMDWNQSDCYENLALYGCPLFSTDNKCDGLNSQKHGVHDCSSVRHWPVTAWYRNKYQP